jgi:arylformamidase
MDEGMSTSLRWSLTLEYSALKIPEAAMRTWFFVGLLLCLSQPVLAGPLLDRLRQLRTPVAGMPTGVQVLREVAYGPDPRQRMDVYLPPGAQQAPVILMVHGGAWKIGDKAMGRVTENKVSRWVARGFIFVSINYRMLPAADPLTQADDVARALAFAQGHVLEQGGDPAAVVLMGHSAGAHLVALLSADPARARAQGAQPWLGTVALDSAAMDLAPLMQGSHLRFYDEAFGKDPAYWRAASPQQMLGAEALPLLAVCSSIRPDKPCAQAHALAQRAQQAGRRAEVLEQALSHEEINEKLGLPGAYTEAVERFMASLSAGLAVRLAP